jgi:hypothetical protein
MFAAKRRALSHLKQAVCRPGTALCRPSHGAMPTLGYIFLRTGLAMEEL